LTEEAAPGRAPASLVRVVVGGPREVIDDVRMSWGMKQRCLAVGVAATVCGLGVGSARAYELPTYICDYVSGGSAVTLGRHGCEASGEAVSRGRFIGPAVIKPREGEAAWECFGPGFAETPHGVLGDDCTATEA
jgi:hypothetical protein